MYSPCDGPHFWLAWRGVVLAGLLALYAVLYMVPLGITMLIILSTAHLALAVGTLFDARDVYSRRDRLEVGCPMA